MKNKAENKILAVMAAIMVVLLVIVGVLGVNMDHNLASGHLIPHPSANGTDRQK